MVHFGFVMEQTLGHVTHGKNLAQRVEQETEVCSVWMPIAPHRQDLWESAPGIRSNWSLKGSLRARDALRQAVRRMPLDALFIHTQTVALFALPFMRRIPTLLSLDATPRNFDRIGVAYGHFSESDSWLERRKFTWHCRVFAAATEIIAWSAWAKQSLVEEYGVAAGKIQVVPPGIDLNLWNGGQDRGTEKDPVRLLFVGADFERKGGPLLLDAFRNGLARRCRLDIVTQDRAVEAELQGAEGIHIHCGLPANSEPLRRLYAQADIFVLPTRGDCLPLAILEALASGLPVVAADVGALNEAVSDGENGLLIPSNDGNALFQALFTLINDPVRRTAFGKAARLRAEERFDAQCNYGTILARMKALTERR